ncbi:MAG: endolytic transglycosylase MltG [Alphaproteobacteria bacterium]|nr:endolytic transglycosylase MltG [Alphaproteobacteria bacterium]
MNWSKLKVLYLILVIIYCGGFHIAYNLIRVNSLPESKDVIISSGMGARQIARLLVKEGVIHNEYLFLLYKKTFFNNNIIIAGEYEFTPYMNLKEVMNQLINKHLKLRKITIAEGLTISQIQKILEDTHGLVGKFPENIEEGSLLPETYLYTSGDDIEKIVAQMRSSMDGLLKKLIGQKNLIPPISDAKKLVILASIIEKEAKLDEEKPIIASVFWNRLKIGMKLQSCATALYGVTDGGKIILGRKLSKEDIQIDSPYNTYKITGLPVGAISCPGKISLEAAINPSDTKYLYFVKCGNRGGHKFATNYADHLANISSPECK